MRDLGRLIAVLEEDIGVDRVEEAGTQVIRACGVPWSMSSRTVHEFHTDLAGMSVSVFHERRNGNAVTEVSADGQDLHDLDESTLVKLASAMGIGQHGQNLAESIYGAIVNDLPLET